MTTNAPTRMGTSSLPSGWKTVRLADAIQEAQVGFASGERDPHGVVQLRMNNVTSRGGFDWSSFIRVPASQDIITFYQLQAGDVLFNNTNSTELVGKSALFTGFDEPVVYSNHFTRLRTRNEILDSAFLSLWLQAQWHSGFFAAICNRWVGQSAIQRDKLLSLNLPLPPLPEQQRIAARLTEQMAAVAVARVAAEAQLAAAKDLPAAYLRAVFESDEAKAWPRKRLGELASIGTGTTPATDQSDYYRGAIPFIKTAEIINNRIGDAKTFVSDEAVSRYNMKIYPAGTVLLAMYGQGKTRGQVGLLKLSATITQNAAAIVPGPELDSEYVWLWLLGQYQATRRIGFQGDLSHLSLAFVKDFLVPVPGIEVQVRTSAHLQSILSNVATLQQRLESQLAAINALPGALLRRAFGLSTDG